jgi:hypothetical protein
MPVTRAVGSATLAAAAALAGGAAWGCELRASEHRSGRELLRAALDSAAPELRVSFVHSVLGTPVLDRYLWRDGRWVLVEERFDGEGYGLPHVAAPGEQLERVAQGWRLVLARPVEPLVVRPLAAQRMRLELDGGRSWLLAELSTQAIELVTDGC